MEEKWLKIVEQSLSGLNFGSVEIVVHNGQVTQIEKRERFRAGQELGVAATEKPGARRAAS
jgi:hypothetical protein